MSKSLYSVEQRLALINDCYTSGLSVYAWCKEKQIAPGTFYSWIHYLKKQGCTLPEVVPVNLREKPVRETHEIVNMVSSTILTFTISWVSLTGFSLRFTGTTSGNVHPCFFK